MHVLTWNLASLKPETFIFILEIFHKARTTSETICFAHIRNMDSATTSVTPLTNTNNPRGHEYQTKDCIEHLVFSHFCLENQGYYILIYKMHSLGEIPLNSNK